MCGSVHGFLFRLDHSLYESGRPAASGLCLQLSREPPPLLPAAPDIFFYLTGQNLNPPPSLMQRKTLRKKVSFLLNEGILHHSSLI